MSRPVERQITVVGGSTPFTAALADALAEQADAMPPHGLILNGRHRRNLETVGRYVRNRLLRSGWTVQWTSDTAAALRGAHVVVHQPRYGGNAGRQQDEDLALRCGLAPDETLGPGALQSALRLRAELDATCRIIGAECPGAWVLNLTNPLSITTARMVRSGVTRCIGVCELPRVTMRKAAAVLGEEPERADWAYTGLNHRGFIVRLAWRGTDRIHDVARQLGEDTLDGIRAGEIAGLGAIPTKYFRLLNGDCAAPTGGRAAFLERLRQRLLDELRRDPGHSPPSLGERYLAWYPEAVVPLIRALCSPEPALLEVNRLTDRGIVEEGRAPVSALGIGELVPSEPPTAVRPWIDRFIRHERCALAAVERPCRESIVDALHADPLVPPTEVADCARLILDGLDR
ncbi:MAG TPA: hypothetical protein VF210_07515 [Pseudomonadales bacterium]